MIRFCDKEVACVSADSLDRGSLLLYFLDGHMDDIICVYNKLAEYKGKITYTSLLRTQDVKDAIQTEYAVLDCSIWQNARNYFNRYQRMLEEIELLPVLNQDHQLVCFAYQDDEANRELRMLDELKNKAGALSFCDAYPEYECVTIDGCNELAFFFAEYLRDIGIAVNVCGDFWAYLGNWDKTETLDYRCFLVYAEGVVQKEEDIRRRLLRSVSAEFECIDKIYEMNQKNGLIKDCEGDVSWLIERLRESNEVVLTGTGMEAQDTFDFLLEHGIEACCFLSEDHRERDHLLFGREILSRTEVVDRCKSPVFVESGSRYSSWGFGGTDWYHYAGYYRNKSYFLIRDYTAVPQNSLWNAVRKRRLVLTGDIGLCSRLYKYFCSQGKDACEIGYWDALKTGGDRHTGMPRLSVEKIRPEDLCLLVQPEYYVPESGEKSRKKLKASLAQKLKEAGIRNYTDYFCHSAAFINMKEQSEKYSVPNLKIGNILLGSINAFSGNILFRDILDGHPNILMMDYCFLNNNLYFLCLRLSQERASDIPFLFWKLYQAEAELLDQTKTMEEAFPDKKTFDDTLKELLDSGNSFTSQELFVMFHIAYARMWGKEILDPERMVIYWEPHFINRNMFEQFAIWLGAPGVNGCILNLVRNFYISAGSFLRNRELSGVLPHLRIGAFWGVLRCEQEEKKDYAYFKRIVIKFEDLKCNPRDKLAMLCDELKLPWSEILLGTTCHGCESYYADISGFDLKPVYNLYEEYFSGFDRMRISLIAAPWQKKYGYPFVSSLGFSRRELQEMFLKEFRFEERLNYNSFEEKMKVYAELHKWERNWLWLARREEVIGRQYD